jgi:agmatine deiminase
MHLVAPGEWEPHARCFMGWPGHEDVAEAVIADLRDAHGEVAKALSRFEPVVMVAHPGLGRQAAAACGRDVEVLEIPLGTGWMRDAGPIFALRGDESVAVDFAFNSWGREPRPYRGSIGERLCRRLEIPREPVALVLEGGSIAFDGAGTLIAVESSILDERRNPGAARDELEVAFRRFLGAERVVWLPNGLPTDKTRGHADNVVAFVGPRQVLCQTTPPGNRAILERAGLEVIPFDLPFEPVRYLNFYVGNGCVLVPQAGTSSDREALRLIGEHFSDREIVAVPGLALARGAGGVHCITQQQPLARASRAPRPGTSDRSHAAADTRDRGPTRRRPPGSSGPRGRTRRG